MNYSTLYEEGFINIKDIYKMKDVYLSPEQMQLI